MSNAVFNSTSTDDFDYDLLIIGGGSGGVRAARWASKKGMKVGVIEESRWGGTCVNVGCVPKKLYVHASHYHELFSAAPQFGWQIEQSPQHRWADLKKNVDAYILRLNTLYTKMLDSNDVDLFEARAVFVDSHTLELQYQEADQSSQRYTAHFILIATGGSPSFPNIEGIEHASSSNDFFALTQAPQSALVIGGGYIGVEMAGILNGLDVPTSLVFRSDLPLRGFDQDIRNHLFKSVSQHGVSVYANQSPSRIELLSSGLKRVHFDGAMDPIDVDLVLAATGRIPNISSMGLTDQKAEELGIKLTTKGAIQVNENYQTHQAHIFAVGDVINRVQLTPVALAEAMRVVEWINKTPLAPLNYQLIPTTVFSQPSVGTVGLTEQQAQEQDIPILIYETDFRALFDGVSGHPNRVYLKLIVHQDSDRVLGCHMVGPHAGEMIQGLGIALQAKASKADFDRTIGIHPSIAEEWVTLRTPRDLNL